MLPTTLKIQITKTDLENAVDHPSKNAIARAIKRQHPYLTEVWVAGSIQLFVYGVGKPSLAVNFLHNPSTTKVLSDTSSGSKIYPLTTTVELLSIKQLGKWVC